MTTVAFFDHRSFSEGGSEGGSEGLRSFSHAVMQSCSHTVFLYFVPFALCAEQLSSPTHPLSFSPPPLFRVISRTTEESFRGYSITSPEIARKLNVTYVLEGSVYKSENKIKLFVQLIDARNDQHILSEKYEDDMTNIFELQSDIAKKIANVLETVLTNAEIGKIESKPTQSFEAYDNFLKARFLVNKANDEQRVDINKQGLMTSLKYYEKAIAADSNFAEAYAGLAGAWYNLCAWGWYKPYYEGVQKALDSSNKALKIDPDCAEAHAVKGGYHIYPEFKIGEAGRELQISIQLNPNFATAHQWYAQLLMITGPH